MGRVGPGGLPGVGSAGLPGKWVCQVEHSVSVSAAAPGGAQEADAGDGRGEDQLRIP